jgi:hypothetical protein
MHKRHLWLGIGFWGLAAVGIWLWATSSSTGEQQRVTSELRRYWTSQRRVVTVRLTNARRLAIGDPIVTLDETGFQQVGEIDALLRDGTPLPDREAVVREAAVIFYSATPPIGPDSQLTLFETPDTLAWVVQTLLPKERTQEVTVVMRRYFEAHREQMVVALRPVVENTVRDALSAIQAEFPLVFEQHRNQLEQLGREYQESVLQEQLLPIIRRDIWPLVQVQAEPLAAEIGWELWKRLSLWSFSWRMAYDWLPLTGQELVRREWSRFLSEEVRPVLNQHQQDFLEIVRQAGMAMARNQDIRDVIGGSLTELLTDPQFQMVMARFFDDLVVRNGRLRDVVTRRWQSNETQDAIHLVSARMEPAAQHVGEIVLGSIEDGLTPEFVQVLRTRILSKDQRWLMLEKPGTTSTSADRIPELKVQLASSRRNRDPVPVITRDVRGP